MKIRQRIAADIYHDAPYIDFCLALVFLMILNTPHNVLLWIVLIIDLYWIFALLNAALRSAEKDPIHLFHFPSRLTGLLLFVCCFSFEVYAFGNLYCDRGSDFMDQTSSKPLEKITDAYYLSLGTMTTVDIVNYSAITKPAKELKAYQVVSNLIMFFAIFPILIARFSSFKDRSRNKDERLTPYNRAFNGKPFNAAAIETFTGLTPNEWCEFSGLFWRGHLNQPFHEFELSGSYPELTLKLETDKKILMTFNLEEKIITIENYLIGSEAETSNKRIIQGIIDLAKRTGFKKIILTAEKDIALGNLGFLKWEKRSFQPTEAFKTAFENITKDYNGKKETLYNLLQEEKGKQIWKTGDIRWEVERAF